MSLSKSEKFGDDVKLWIGQIVEDSTWNDNENREKWTDTDAIKGWGARYKVRILSQHSDNKTTVPDEKLPMVDVMYPVTGGSGHGASFQSANLRKGTFVIGFYRDGIGRTEPIIIGCLANNDQTTLEFQNPNSGFVPRSGLTNERSPVYSVPPDAESGQGNKPGQPTESVGGYCTWESYSDVESKKRGEEASELKKTHKCGDEQLFGIQLEILNMIKRIESMRNRITKWNDSVTNFGNSVKREIERAAKFVSKLIKNVIEDIRKFVTDKVTNGINDLHYLLFPDKRGVAEVATNKVIDLIMCLFDKIVDQLLSMILDFLLQIVDRYINAPLCAIEKFLQTLLGQLFGYILGAVESILSSLTSVFGVALSIADSLIGLFKSLFSFFSCEPDPDCPEIKEWSTWNGANANGGSFNFDITSIISEIESVANQVKDTIDPDSYDFNVDFSGTIQNSIDSCNVGPILCGPPTVEFFGGGGSGAAANAIIGLSGEILGIDITSPGSGYKSPPFAKIVDSCGNGTGAVLQPTTGFIDDPNNDDFNNNDDIIVDEDTGTIISIPIDSNDDPTRQPVISLPTDGEIGEIICSDIPKISRQLDLSNKKVLKSTNVGVTGVIVLRSGTGYLNSADGSLGGSGRTWAEKNQTVVRRSTGKYDPPYYPGQIVTLNSCDEVLPPYSDPIKITEPQTDYITPNPEDDEYNVRPNNPRDINNYNPNNPPPKSKLPSRKYTYPTNDKLEYEVILNLCDLYINNPGINYSAGDKIIISPDNGATAEPVFGAFGRLEKINIINQGSYFTSRPQITIQSSTGYNAEIVPILCVNRIGDLDPSKEILPEPDKILKVVDCVGKFR
jgi:hypothetical protein